MLACVVAALTIALVPPVHNTVYPPPPVTVPFSDTVLPAHAGTGLTVAVTAAGSLFTITFVVAVRLQPCASVYVTLYTPDIAVVLLLRVGFWAPDEKPPGPLHA